MAARVRRDGAQLDDEAIAACFAEVDERLLAEAKEHGFDCGATVLLAVLGEQGERAVKLVQLGDSQVARCGAFGAEALCAQHRTDNLEESSRLEAVHAEVDDFGRVVGRRKSLAVTRSMGDADLKEVPGVIAIPEVSDEVLSASDEVLVLGCDGLWDVLGAEDVWDVAKRRGKGKGPAGGWDLVEAARGLVIAAYDNKSGDNISVIVISARKPRRGRLRATANMAALHIAKPEGEPNLKPEDMSVALGADGRVLSVRRKANTELVSGGSTHV